MVRLSRKGRWPMGFSMGVDWAPVEAEDPSSPGTRTQGPSLCPRRLLGTTGWEPGQGSTAHCGEGRGVCPVSREPGVDGASGPQEHGQGPARPDTDGSPLARAGRASAHAAPPPGPAPWPSRGSWHLDDLSSLVWLAASEPLPSGPVSQLPLPIPAPGGLTTQEGHGGPTQRALVLEEGAALASAWAPSELVAVVRPLLGWAWRLPSADPPSLLRWPTATLQPPLPSPEQTIL